MSINQLPPEMLAIVLSDKRISLSERIALRAVSTHWQDTIEQHVLKPVTKLALNHHSCDDDVPPLPFKAQLIPLYARLFPALADLTIANDISANPSLPRLLTAFNTTLTTLKLRLREGFMPDHEDHELEVHSVNHGQWLSLASAINSLTVLTSLELDLRQVMPPNTLLLRLVPTLPRLQKFNYSPPSRVPTAEHWQNITLGPLMRMTNLKIKGTATSDYAATVADTVATFPSLQSLNLNLVNQESEHDAHFADMLRSLSTLEHLSELNLSRLYNSNNQLPLPTDRTLIQVTKLSLVFDSVIEDSQLFTSMLVAWFPSLEVLNLICDGFISLTSTTLRNFARLEHLSELGSDIRCALEVPLDFPTNRPLANLKTLHMTIGADNPAEQLFSSALVAWFPRLEKLTLVLEKDFQGTDTMLRDLSLLEHLSEFYLFGLQPKKDPLNLPSSSDRPLCNVKKFHLSIHLDLAYRFDGKYLFAALAAWFPGLERLTIDAYGNDDYEAFELSMEMLSEFATLKHLTELSLHNLNYAGRRFLMPSSTDKVLPRVKDLYLQFNPYFSCNFGVERHICSVLAAWFSGLEKLEIIIYYGTQAAYTFYLTSSMLADLSRLEHLRELNLPIMLYSKEYIEAPSPTDRPLTCLDKLALQIVDLPAEFDGEHFCSTVAAWLPCLEEVVFHRPRDTEFENDEDEDDEDDEEDEDNTFTDYYAAYETAIKANRHHFANSTKLIF